MNDIIPFLVQFGRDLCDATGGQFTDEVASSLRDLEVSYEYAANPKSEITSLLAKHILVGFLAEWHQPNYVDTTAEIREDTKLMTAALDRQREES